MMKGKLFGLLIIVLISMTGFAQYDFTVKPGSTVTVNNNAHLNIRNGGDLLLQDDYVNAPSFLSKGTVSITGGGKAKVEQFVTRDAWHMVASPTSNENISAYMWMYLYKYFEPNNTWNYLNQPVTLPLIIGTGYFLYSYSNPPGGYPPSEDYAILDGNLNYLDVNLNLSNTPSSPKSGWNLLGNPYPCAIYWNGEQAWNLNNVAASIYITNPQTGNYEVWNYNTGGTNSNGGYIAATQGFWIRAADTTGILGSITIPQSQRCHNNAEFYKSTGAFLQNQLLIKVEGQNGQDKTIIGFIENSTPEFDPAYDAVYLRGSETSPALFSLHGNGRYAMNHYPSYEQYNMIPMGLINPVPGLMTLNVSWIESLPDDLPVYLEDKMENIWTNLRENSSYSYIAGLNDPVNRLNIHFANPMGIDPMIAENNIRIYSWDKTIYVKIPFAIEGAIEVYNVMGQKISDQNAIEGTNEIEVNQERLHYIVKVISNRGITTQKVYVQ